jgi:hypothetical protein
MTVLPRYAKILNARKDASDRMDINPPLTVPVEAGGVAQEPSNMDGDRRPLLCIILPPQRIIPSASTAIPTKCVPPRAPSLKTSRKRSMIEQENIYS